MSPRVNDIEEMAPGIGGPSKNDHEAEIRKLKLFAYSISHDLKSPAIAVFALAKRLQKRCSAKLDEKENLYLTQIAKATEYMVDLIDKTNRTISAKELPLDIRELSLGEAFAKVRNHFNHELETRRISWKAVETDRRIFADELLVARALVNLVENALKYGGKSLSEIILGHHEQGHLHTIFVKDNGKGMKPEHHTRLFQAFQRGTNQITGSGLGLALVDEIAQRHGGKLWAERNLPTGTIFYFTISKKVI